jgi:hypothetical protein
MVDYQTRNCIECYRPARVWTGHVHKGAIKVIAGWCSLHRQKSVIGLVIVKCQGCFGRWNSKMKIEKA